ncbi:MAG: VWA domain-containing protein [Archangiaceae bacterium]|nr:VWA domain-containing protein [Archangiaceae bacterium]
MGGLIEGAKEKIWSIASRMAAGKPTPRIRVGLVAYRDRGDAYETKRFDLTEDLDTVYKNMRAFRAEGGGDGPEHVGKGLGEAVKLMSWNDSKRTAKLIFVVGDAPAHDDYQDGFTLATMAKLAIEKGIVVNTIRCGDDATTATQFQQVAKLADGSFISIGQSGGMVAVATPFDAELSKLNGELARKSAWGGSTRGRAVAEESARDVEAMGGAAAADRLSYRAKSTEGGGLAAAPASAIAIGGIDLIADPSKVDGLKEEELPANLKGMKASERKPWLEKQAAERKALEAKVLELAKNRDAWLTKNASAKKDSFDENVMKSVKASADKVGVAYE